MAVRTEVFVPATAGATLTLRAPAVAVRRVSGLVGTTAAPANLQGTVATIVTAAPTGTQAQFTGTPQNPSRQVVLGPGWTAGSIVIVEYEDDDQFPIDR